MTLCCIPHRRHQQEREQNNTLLVSMARKLFDLFITTIQAGTNLRIAHKQYPSGKCWVHFMEKFHMRTYMPSSEVEKASKGYH